MTWLADSKTFAYAQLQKLPPGAPVTEAEQKMRTYLHTLGTDAAKDQVLFGYGAIPSIPVEPTWFGGIICNPGTNYALGLLSAGTRPENVYYVEPATSLGKTNSDWRKLADFSDDVTDVVSHGDDLYLLSFKDASRYKVLRTSANHPNLTTAEVVVSPSAAVITEIHGAQDALYIKLLDGGINRVLRVPYGPHPQVQEIVLPVQGSAGVDTDLRVPGALISLTSWTQPRKIYSYDPQNKSVADTKLQPVSPLDESVPLEAVEVKAPAADGKQIPLSISYRKGLKLDGSNPTLLMGYGAYGIPIDSAFSSTRLAWYEKGGVYAVCHVRGGGEYGEEWHLAGKGATKPNTWHDFIACGEYLIAHNYTSSSRLAGQGGSAGGILIGRTITERPNLLAAAIDQVGVSDTLRFEESANGVPNIPEFGSTKTAEGYKALYEMSSYHHIQDETAYPAVLFETGMNDPRVDPWHMAKMAARMQAATSSGRPCLLRVEYEGGHGSIGGTAKQIEERLADEYSFLFWQFGIPEFQPH